MRFRKNIFSPKLIKGGSKSYSRFSNARKCEIDGITFASGAEGSLYVHLKAKYEKIFCQPKVYLTKSKILLKPDFFTEDSIFHEMKGRRSAVYGIKERLWKHYGPATMYVYKISRGQVVLDYTVIPEACDELDKP